MKSHPLRLKLRETTSNAILEAAEQVAARDGLPNAALQTIAERAGIAVGTIYNYFQDKQELIDALFTRRRQELYDAIDAEARRHARDSFERQLDAFVRAVFTHFDARRDFLRIALEVTHEGSKVVKEEDGRKRPAMQQLQNRAERVVRIGLREKRLREDAADLLAAVLVSILRGVLIVRSQGERPFVPETERVVALFLQGAAR
jgi:AcrR family transcriptional regulator